MTMQAWIYKPTDHGMMQHRMGLVALWCLLAVIPVGAIGVWLAAGSNLVLGADIPAFNSPTPSAQIIVVTPAPATPVEDVPPAMASSLQGASADEMPTFDGRPLRKARSVQMVVTGYSPDARSCGKWADGITASGYSVWTNGMCMVAADTRLLPFGSLVSIPGYNRGRPVPVLDRGGAIKGHRLDLLFPSHEIARSWGKRKLNITVWEYAG